MGGEERTQPIPKSLFRAPGIKQNLTVKRSMNIHVQKVWPLRDYRIMGFIGRQSHVTLFSPRRSCQHFLHVINPFANFCGYMQRQKFSLCWINAKREAAVCFYCVGAEKYLYAVFLWNNLCRIARNLRIMSLIVGS